VHPPRIVGTFNAPAAGATAASAEAKRSRYLDAIRRAGGEPLALDPRAGAAERSAAFASMDGLLITGGGDLDPARFGAEIDGADPPDPGRDELDEAAYRAAVERGVPVLGVCRGLQVVNVFEGGSLVQHLEGHESEPYPSPRVTSHPIALAPGSRLARILSTTETLVVNSYHHQAVRQDQLAPTLRTTATAEHDEHGLLVEALEAADPERWLIGIQCHPERTESSPAVLEQLWIAFVDACRSAAD
jgi:putative glutamine amidotransferase